MSAGSSSFSKADPFDSAQGRRLDRWLAALAFVLFALSSSRFAFPDESASLLTQHLHLTPFYATSHPLWGWIMRVLAAIPIGSMAALPNLFSAACGAGCVWLTFCLVRRLEIRSGPDKAALVERTLAAAGAALYLMVAPPFWMVSNRAHPGSFDLLLLLGLLWLLCRFRDTGQANLTRYIPMLLVIGAAESPTILLCAPVLGLYFLLLLRQRRQLNVHMLARILAAAVPGLLLYLVSAWLYARTPVAGWREFSGVGQSLWYILVEQWGMIKNCVPRQGWLLLFFASFLPWACCAWMPGQSHESARRPGAVTLLVVITGLALAILFNARFAPWRLTVASPLLVAPYVMIAAYFGYAVGYWHGYATSRLRRVRSARPAPTAAFALAAGLLLAVAGWRNHAVTNSRGVAAFNQLARAMVQHAAGRTMVFTEGLADAPMLVAARDIGATLDVFNIRLAGNLAYRRFAASRAESPRLQALARIGFLPFLMQWLKTDSNVVDRLAFQMSPDFWLSTGHGIVPNGSLYLGVRDGAEPDVEKLLQDQRAFWKSAGPALAATRKGTPPMKKLGEAAARHVSSVANDVGVFLENYERLGEAQEAYRSAIALAPRNLSAHLNLFELLCTAGDTNSAARVEMDTERLAGEIKLPMKTLIETYGHVRTRAALARLQELWNRTPASAVPPPPALQEAMDAMARGDNRTARATLEKLVRDQPRLEHPWILLATLAHEENDRVTLMRCVEHMRSEEKEWPQVLVMVGEDALARRDSAKARMYFERAAFLWPENTKVMEWLVKLDLADQKLESVAGRLDVLLTIDPKNAVGNFALGAILFHGREYELAEQAYRAAIAGPGYPPALNNLAWLLQMQGRLDEALELSRAATQADPTSYNAWDTLGVVQMKRDAFDAAESSLKMAQAINAEAPDARVHLAELLARRGQREEARAAAKSVLADHKNLSEDLRRPLRDILK